MKATVFTSLKKLITHREEYLTRQVIPVIYFSLEVDGSYDDIQ